MVQYAMGVDIFRRVPERRLARRRAAEQNGEFGIEADEAFEYARRALHRLPGGADVGRVHDPRLALAVVAKAPRFEDRGRANPGDRRVELIGRRYGRIRRRTPAEAGDEILLAQPVQIGTASCRERVCQYG